MRNLLRSIPSPPTSTPRKGSRLTVLGALLACLALLGAGLVAGPATAAEPPAAHHQAATSENLGAQLSPEDLAEIMSELRAEGYKSTSTVEGNTLRTVFQVEGLQVGFEEPARQSRVSWGEDHRGFFIKLEWYEQVALATAGAFAGGPIAAGIRVLVRVIFKTAMRRGAQDVTRRGLNVLIATALIATDLPCTGFQAKYIRFNRPSHCGR